MRGLRKFLIGLCVLIGIAAILVGVATFVLATQSGSAWLVRTIEARSDGLFAIDQVSGKLTDTMILTGLETNLPSGTVRISRLSVGIELRGLLARALVIDRLDIAEVRYLASETAVGDSEGPGGSPVMILIREMNVQRILVESDGQITEIGPVSLGARIVDDQIDFEDIVAAAAGFSIEADAEIELGSEISFDVDACWRGTYEDEQISGCSTMAGTLAEIELVVDMELPFEADVAGTVTFGATPQLDLRGAWTDASLIAAPDIRSPEAAFEVFGPIDALNVSGDGSIETQGRAASFSFAAETNFESIQFNELDLNGEFGEVDLAGEFVVSTLSATFDVRGRGFDPALVMAQWPGSLDISGRVSTTLGPAIEFSIENLLVGGQVRGYPITARGAVAYDSVGWRFDKVSILSRTDRIELDGDVAEEVTLQVSADIADMALLYPGLLGSVTGNVNVTGTVERPRLRGSAELLGVSYGEYSAGRIYAIGAAGLAVGSNVNVDLEVDNLVGPNVRVIEAAGTVDGNLAGHTIDFAATSDQWVAESRLVGAYDDERWSGRVERLDVNPVTLGSWQLTNPVEATFGPNFVAIGLACLQRSGSEICAEGSISGAADDRLVVNAANFDLESMAPFFPEGFYATGIYTIAANIENVTQDPTGTFSLAGRNTQLRFSFSEGEILETTIDELSLNAGLVERALDLRGELSSTQLGHVELILGIGDIRDDDSPVSGRLDVQWDDVAILSVLSPEVGEVGGQLSVAVDIAGSRGEPTIDGRATLNDGSLSVPEWGLVIESIEANATVPNTRTAVFTATGLVGESRLDLTGETVIDLEAGFPTTLKLQGESVPLIQLAGAEVFVSPDLDVAVALPSIDVSGTVDIPRAHLSRVGLPEQAISASPDAVIHGVQGQEAVRPLDVHASLIVRLGDDVTFVDGSLSADVTGELAVDYDSGATTAARGTLIIDGQYDAYGNSLALERGRLVFAGPWDNPALDVRAARYIDDITVGVELRGTLQAPQTRIYSEPVMGEADALSYLLFGRPLDSSAETDSAALQAAALSMGLRQALPVIERVGESLGFDEFTVRTTGSSAGALMAGKYLSPRLYIRYSYGLFNRIGGLLLRFKINERLSVETQSGEQKSMDLLYTVEKD